MNVLVIDVGGSHVKILASGQQAARKVVSGPKMAPETMVTAVRQLAAGWSYEVVSIGYPGPVSNGRITLEPHNLAAGWTSFDFEAAFACPVRVINDAAMQALGSYKSGKMLFLGLGTGLGSAMIVRGYVVPLELAHLPYRKGTFEDYVGLRGLVKNGKKKWREHVTDVVARLTAALLPDEIVIGGGNAKELKTLPSGSRLCTNASAFQGGFRLWEQTMEVALAEHNAPTRTLDPLDPTPAASLHGDHEAALND